MELSILFLFSTSHFDAFMMNLNLQLQRIQDCRLDPSTQCVTPRTQPGMPGMEPWSTSLAALGETGPVEHTTAYWTLSGWKWNLSGMTSHNGRLRDVDSFVAGAYAYSTGPRGLEPRTDEGKVIT